jgi:hypothetical protein
MQSSAHDKDDYFILFVFIFGSLKLQGQQEKQEI